MMCERSRFGCFYLDNDVDDDVWLFLSLNLDSRQATMTPRGVVAPRKLRESRLIFAKGRGDLLRVLLLIVDDEARAACPQFQGVFKLAPDQGPIGRVGTAAVHTHSHKHARGICLQQSCHPARELRDENKQLTWPASSAYRRPSRHSDCQSDCLARSSCTRRPR
jgi:hypothetical protein